MYWSSGRHWGRPISKMLTHFIIHIKTSHPLVSLSISSGESVVKGSCQVLMVNTVFQSSNYVWEVKLYDGQQILSVFFEKTHLVHFQEKISNTQTEWPLVCGSLFQGTRLTVHFQSQNITKMSIQGLGLHLVTFTVLSKPWESGTEGHVAGCHVLPRPDPAKVPAVPPTKASTISANFQCNEKSTCHSSFIITAVSISPLSERVSRAHRTHSGNSSLMHGQSDTLTGSCSPWLQAPPQLLLPFYVCLVSLVSFHYSP